MRKGSPSHTASHQPHILLLVLVGDGDVLAIGLEIVVGDLPKSIVLHSKRGLDHTLNIVLTVTRDSSLIRAHLNSA